MASQSDSNFSGSLINEEAARWLLESRSFGANLLDRGLSFAAESFGPERRVGAYVPPQPPPFAPRIFFLSIEGDINRDDDWDRLVATHLNLGERQIAADPEYLKEARTFRPTLWTTFPEWTRMDEAMASWFHR